MPIPQHFSFVDLALQYKDTLIIGDLQLGYETVLHKQGVLIPTFQLKDIFKHLDYIFSKTTAKRVVINGDIKHEFGTISDQEWRETLQLFDYLLEKVEEVIVVKGNHDLVLGPIAKKRNLKIVDAYTLDDVTFLHGHVILPNLGKTIVIGHEHPAITFPERPGEKYKCFLVGKWKGHTLIVLPSFNPLTEGSDVTQGSFLSPFLKEDMKHFTVYAVEDYTVFPFGKVKDLQKL